MEAEEQGLLERRAEECDARLGRSLGMVIVVACIVLVAFFVRRLTAEPGPGSRASRTSETGVRGN